MKHQKKESIFALCAGRHNTPAEKAIFNEIENPLDFNKLAMVADEVIPEGTTELTVYVTGLTPAMLAVTQVCVCRGIDLTAMHYDKNSGHYYPQTVTRFKRCPFCGGDTRGFGQYCPHCGSN